MPMLNKLFGANPELIKTIAHKNIFFGTSGSVDFNGVQTLLIYNGLFVTLLFFRHLVMMCWKKNNYALIVMVICCIWLMLGETYYLCSRLFFTTVLMHAIITQRNANMSKVAVVRKD